MNEFAIEICDVWKIFGDRSHEALHAVKSRALSKAQMLSEFNCVLGVANANMQIRSGEIFCIMGLSGSGKSTLVRHINRLLEPTSGNILVNGVDVMGMNEQELRDFRNAHIAMVFQNFGLMPHRSVLDNIAMPLEIRGINKTSRLETASRCLELVELGGWGNKFAHELSGGMQQRVGLARALASDPEILLMDEPFSALDPLIRRQLQTQFMQLAANMNKTTVFITHDLDEAVRIGAHIAIMRDGAVVQIGTPEEIVMHPADEYVADFVAGISRLKVVRAHAIMQPIAEFESQNGSLAAEVAEYAENTPLGTLITQAIHSDIPSAITNEQGERVGVITRQDLLRTVIDGTETS